MRILVRNLPLHSYVDAWIDVPDGTSAEQLQGAIAVAVVERGYQIANPDHRHDDLDEEIIRSGWEFQVRP